VLFIETQLKDQMHYTVSSCTIQNLYGLLLSAFLYWYVWCYAEQNVEYIRSHYNIEDFIYFNHHRREEHAHLHHYALNPVFKLFSKMFLKVHRLQFRPSTYLCCI